MKTKADLTDAAWQCFQAARRVAQARDVLVDAHSALRHAQNAHARAAELQREIEEELVRQAGGEQLRVVS